MPALVKKIWNLDLQTVSYDDLDKVIGEARADEKAVALAKQRAEAYLAHARHEIGDQAGICRQLFPARPGLPSHHGGGQLSRDHDQRLHVDDHAQGAHLGLPHVEHAQ